MHGVWSIMQKITGNSEQNNAKNYEQNYLSPSLNTMKVTIKSYTWSENLQPSDIASMP